MIPYNFIERLALEEQAARFLAGQKIQQLPGAQLQVPSVAGVQSQQQPHCQIQVNSTIDADIVLRRVIEDRAAILALKSRAETNEAELAKAKKRQLQLAKVLDLQDEEIAKLATKAKLELAEYHENSREYVRSFMLAFNKGKLNKLPRHPFTPSLADLEDAVNRRKSCLVEKTQTDDRVKRLAFISSRERVESSAIKKNEEAFLRAIEISKQKFSESCEAWINRLDGLLSTLPPTAHVFDKTQIDKDVENQIIGTSQQAQMPQVQAPVVFKSLLPRKRSHEQDLGRAMTKPAIKSVWDVIPSVVKEETEENKRQKTDHIPTPMASNVIDLSQSRATSPSESSATSGPYRVESNEHSLDEEISVAQVLTSLHDSEPKQAMEDKFVVPDI